VPAHRTIAAEHRALDALFGETRAVLRVAEARGAARLAIAHLLEQVKSHLFREESLYYPRRFEEFTRLFQEHEGAEEKLLETLEQELIERKLR